MSSRRNWNDEAESVAVSRHGFGCWIDTGRSEIKYSARLRTWIVCFRSKIWRKPEILSQMQESCGSGFNFQKTVRIVQSLPYLSLNKATDVS